MAGEPFFVPSTAWGAELATAPQPSFLPGESSPAWLDGPSEVKEIVMTAEPVITLLYLAGYAVPEIVIGVGDAASQWVTFDPADVRIRAGSQAWSTSVGSPHPGNGVRAAAIRATPMPHRQRRLDPADPEGPIPMPLIIAATTLDAQHGGWVVLDMSPAQIPFSVSTMREAILQPVITALTTFQAARTMPGAPGLAGMYDPTNWRALVPVAGVASTADDHRQTLQRVVLRFTAGANVWLNDDDPATRPTVAPEDVLEFLEPDIPHPARPPFKQDQALGWDCLKAQIAKGNLGIRARDDALRELAQLKSAGADPGLQSLTSTILDFHDRDIVDVLDGFASVSDAAEPCTQALALARDLTTPLTAAAVTVMCACLDNGITTDSHEVARRLADDYASMYDDIDSRTRIRATLIAACETADSHNPSLNPSTNAAAADTVSAEFFAGLLAATLISEPVSSAAGFTISNYLNPLLEVADTWDRWLPLLDGRPASTKLISLTCDVFADCGHPEVARQAAERVINHYRSPLFALARTRKHHWSHPVFGQEFQGWGSTRATVEGWREATLVSMLAMLTNTHDGSALTALHDPLTELVGPDPLDGYSIDDFESAYGDLLGGSDEPLVGEYALLLGLTAAYSATTSEAEAARYNAMPLELRLGELAADPNLVDKLEAWREEAFVSVENEWLSIEDLQMAMEAYARSPRHQLLLACLDDQRRQARQEDLIDRIRRVCPAAIEVVLGTFVGVSFAVEAGSLIEAIDEDDLAAMLDDVGQVHQFPAPAFTRYLAKVLKEGPVGLPKAYFTDTLKATAEADDLMVAARRKELWDLMIPTGPTEAAITRYLRGVDVARGLPKVDTAASAGHVVTFFVAGVVLWQFAVDGTPTDPDSIVSATRDLLMTVPAMAQVGALAVKWFAQDPDRWIDLIDGIAVVGTFATKLSSFISLLTNGVAMVRYIAQGDTWGALLMAGATAASVVAFVAVGGGFTAPVGAIAATIAALLVLIDVVRKYVKARNARQRALWQTAVIDPQLLFASAVSVVTPHGGDFSPTFGSRAETEVSEIGFVAFPLGTPEPIDPHEDVHEWAVVTGITSVYALTAVVTDGTGFTVSSPIPAVMSASANNDHGARPVLVNESLVSLRPRFESWVEVLGTDFDAVFVARGDAVALDDEVATFAGESFLAPHDGIVGAVESLDDGFVDGRIRIWAVAP